MSGTWERETGVTCVWCPDCAFTFDSFHSDQFGAYSCPACAESRFRGALEAILAAYHGHAFHDPDELQLLPFQMKELALIALAPCSALDTDDCPQSSPERSSR